MVSLRLLIAIMTYGEYPQKIFSNNYTEQMPLVPSKIRITTMLCGLNILFFNEYNEPIYTI